MTEHRTTPPEPEDRCVRITVTVGDLLRRHNVSPLELQATYGVECPDPPDHDDRSAP